MESEEKILQDTFLEEATQLLLDAEHCLLELEDAIEKLDLIDYLFRLAHNIKGSAKAVGFPELGCFVHEMESFLLKIRSKEIHIDPEIITTLLSCIDLLASWIVQLKVNPKAQVDSQPLLDTIRKISASTPASAQGITGFGVFEDGSHVSSKEQAETSTKEQAEPSKESTPPVSQDESIRVPLKHLDELLNDIGELVILQSVLKHQKSQSISPLFHRSVDQLSLLIRQIQNNSMRMRMVPLSQTFQKMQRIMRDTCTALGKNIKLHISGEATGLDKIILDKLGDPLVHLIRNAVDHGIEMPEERSKIGKPVDGNIWLSAFHQGGKLVIEIKDDGRGIDPIQVIAAAKKRGVLAADAEMSDEAACQLIFHPGFSTKTQVTDISGRGVGLDVVKTNITNLKGEVQLESQLGKGACFRILLPLTLAIIDGMIIGLNESERYVVPLSQVHEIFEVKGTEQFTMGQGQEVFEIRGKILPLYHLNKILGRATHAIEGRGVIIVTRIHQKEYAFTAERVISQQQVVIKQLGRDLKKINGVSGSAILGDGKAALILDLEEITIGRSA